MVAEKVFDGHGLGDGVFPHGNDRCASKEYLVTSLVVPLNS
jgi:hypothetical protein